MVKSSEMLLKILHVANYNTYSLLTVNEAHFMHFSHQELFDKIARGNDFPEHSSWRFFAFFRFISAVGQLNLRFIAAGRGSSERQRLIFLHLLTKLMSSLPDVLSLEYSSYVRTSRSAHKFTRLHILVFFSFAFQLSVCCSCAARVLNCAWMEQEMYSRLELSINYICSSNNLTYWLSAGRNAHRRHANTPLAISLKSFCNMRRVITFSQSMLEMPTEHGEVKFVNI